MELNETADQETSSDEYAERFAGSVGSWFLAHQASIISDLVPKDSTVLEVGGGHGQLVDTILEKPASLTIYGSSDQCQERIRNYLDSGRISFVSGSLVNLPFPDLFFDAVVSIRLLTHSSHWQRIIEELCRVAHKKVIIDYPSRRSFNIFYRFLFPLKKSTEKTTRPYHVFTDIEIRNEFRRCGFILQEHHPQFFLPMVVYRKLNNERIASLLERFFSALGVTRLFGSPTIASFTRCSPQ